MSYYDDDKFTEASNKLFDAVAAMKEAGVSDNDIENKFNEAMEIVQPTTQENTVPSGPPKEA